MPTVQLHPDRIRKERFAYGLKRVVEHSEKFTENGLVTPGSKAEKDLATLIQLLGQGSPIPERFYRNHVDDGQDWLLNDFGIKHLHLGGATSDILLFLVEYEGRVVFLEISDHNVFAESPVGSTLRLLHENALRKSENAAAAKREEAKERNAAARSEESIEAKKMALKAALRPRKSSASEGAE